MLDHEQVTFLEGGCALIVGAVAADGRPVATRGWGLDVLDPDAVRVRILLAQDDVLAGQLQPAAALAITGTDVRTLRSLQLKGTVELVDPSADDRARADRFCDEFFTDIVETDLTPRHIVERLRPGALFACVVVVTTLYDQTPGPAAGMPLHRTA